MVSCHCAGNHGGPSAQQIDIQLLKFKFAHLLTFSLVALPVASQSRFPSASFRGAGKERQIGRVPVTLHKRFKLAMVPRFHLGEQNVLDAFFKIGALVSRSFIQAENCPQVVVNAVTSCPALLSVRRGRKAAEVSRSVEGAWMHCKAMGAAKLRYFSLAVSAN